MVRLTFVLYEHTFGYGVILDFSSHLVLYNVTSFSCYLIGKNDFILQSSGSGSESGVQTQKSIKSKSIDSDYNDRSSDDNDGDNASMDYGDKNDSDNDSGTQVLYDFIL